MKRRAFLLGGLAAAVVVGPFAANGLEGFLRRSVARHFGEPIAGAAGVRGFVAAYAARYAERLETRSLGAQVNVRLYVAVRADGLYRSRRAERFERRFLQMLLTRTNVIAYARGAAPAFEWGGVDPWAPGCPNYLSADYEM